MHGSNDLQTKITKTIAVGRAGSDHTTTWQGKSNEISEEEPSNRSPVCFVVSFRSLSSVAFNTFVSLKSRRAWIQDDTLGGINKENYTVQCDDSFNNLSVIDLVCIFNSLGTFLCQFIGPFGGMRPCQAL